MEAALSVSYPARPDAVEVAEASQLSSCVKIHIEWLVQAHPLVQEVMAEMYSSGREHSHG